MKPLRLIPLGLLGFVLGCDNRPAGNSPPPPGSTGGYLDNMVQAKQRAEKTTETAQVNDAIKQYFIQEGRFPNTLEELEDKSFIVAIPIPPAGLTWKYDTNNGVASLEAE